MNIIPVEISDEIIERKIHIIRGQKVMLDIDLAKLYGVETKALKRSVKRNLERFPGDFMFELKEEEMKNLRYQIGTSSWGGTRYVSYAFTELGIAMLASVLNSKRGVQINILIMRVFVKLRRMIASHEDLARRVDDLERKYGDHDETINAIFTTIKKLLDAPMEEEKDERPMGFV